MVLRVAEWTATKISTEGAISLQITAPRTMPTASATLTTHQLTPTARASTLTEHIAMDTAITHIPHVITTGTVVSAITDTVTCTVPIVTISVGRTPVHIIVVIAITTFFNRTWRIQIEIFYKFK